MKIFNTRDEAKKESNKMIGWEKIKIIKVYGNTDYGIDDKRSHKYAIQCNDRLTLRVNGFVE